MIFFPGVTALATSSLHIHQRWALTSLFIPCPAWRQHLWDTSRGSISWFDFVVFLNQTTSQPNCHHMRFCKCCIVQVTRKTYSFEMFVLVCMAKMLLAAFELNLEGVSRSDTMFMAERIKVLAADSLLFFAIYIFCARTPLRPGESQADRVRKRCSSRFLYLDDSHYYCTLRCDIRRLATLITFTHPALLDHRWWQATFYKPVVLYVKKIHVS